MVLSTNKQTNIQRVVQFECLLFDPNDNVDLIKPQKIDDILALCRSQ